MTKPTENAVDAGRRPKYGWPSIAIAIVAALFYAYVFWGAVQNLIELPAIRRDATPWWLLILDVVLPVRPDPAASQTHEVRLRVVARPDRPVAELLHRLGLNLPTAPKVVQNVVEKNQP